MGLSGSGKSTVGPLLAERLGYAFVDLDREIERAAGRTIGSIFRDDGEDRFRTLEREAARALSGRSRTVVATGGGWMAQPESRPPREGRVRVWLRTRPETAIHRLAGAGVRPLLEGDDPVARLRRLLASREEAYAEAEIHVDTDGRRPEEVAEAVVARLASPESARMPTEQETEESP